MIQNSSAAAIEEFVDALLFSVQQGGNAYALTCLRFPALVDVASQGPGIEHGIANWIGEQLDLIPLSRDPVGEAASVRLVAIRHLVRNGSFGEPLDF